MDKPIIYLGWANGWSGTPEVLQEASKNNFPTKEIYHRGCETGYECETDSAIIRYKVDSSD